MIAQQTYIDIGQDYIHDLDADEYGRFIAFTENKKVITNEYNFKIDIDIIYPVIRRLNYDTFFIADRRTDKSLNGHIYNFTGQKIKSFLAGDGIRDVIIQHDKIVIAYHDEGVFGDKGPNNEGISFFDFSGNQLLEFNSRIGWGGIMDCYCICKHGSNSVLFCTYILTEAEIRLKVQVQKLNLETLEATIYETPAAFSGASAISSKQDKIFFHSIYDDQLSFFFWDSNNHEVVKFGGYGSRLKGIGNGKFLAVSDKGYTIIGPT